MTISTFQRFTTSHPLVIKYGGNAMVDVDLKNAFASDVAEMFKSGNSIAVVHGGGPNINEMLKKFNVEGEFRGGFRVTSESAMKVVRLTLAGEVRTELVNLFNQHDLRSIGLSGEDGVLFRAKHRLVNIDGILTDIGYVGDACDVDVSLIQYLLDAQYLPIISSYAADYQGTSHNINADTAAGAIAGAIKARELMMLTDVPGIYRNWPDRDSLITRMSLIEAQQLLPKLASGMVPKVEAAINALNLGVNQVRIVDGREQNIVYRSIENDLGTVIYHG